MARLMIVAPPELAVGFRLAGTDVVTVTDLAETASSLDRLAADPEVGVVGVYAPFFDGLAPEVRRVYEDSIVPVFIPVPLGSLGIEPRDHRARLAALMQRAIGYRISFGEDGDQ